MIKRIRILLPILMVVAMLASMLGMAIPVGASQITATKEHTAPFADFYYVGDTIYYEMTVVNPPANTAINTIVEIWDTLPDGTVVYFIQEGIDPPLVQNPGDVEYFYGSYEVDEADIIWIPALNGYGVKNKFEARGYDSEGDDVQALVTKNSNVIRPEISIEKLVDFNNDGIFNDLETNHAGEAADWAIVVTNTGFDPVYDIMVSDDNMGIDFYGPFDLLANGDFEVIPVYTTYPMADFENTACAEGVDDLGNSVGPVCDPAEVVVVGIPNICVEKTVDCNDDGIFLQEDYGYAGDTGHWKVVVTNCGDTTLYDVWVWDDLYGILDIIGEFTAGDSRTYEYDTTVNVDTTNWASADGSDIIGGYAYDEDWATNYVISPEISIEKTVDFDGDGVYGDSETYYAGEPASWAIVVTNTGASPVYDIMVTDDNGTNYGPFDLLANGDSEIIPVYTTYPVADFVNTACAEGVDELGGAVGPVCDAAEVLVISPEISIEKLVDFDGDGVFTDLETNIAGADADWAIVVTNIGDAPVYNIYVSDDNMGIDFYGPFDLLANGDTEIIPIYTTNPTVDTVNTACAVGEDEIGGTVGPVCDAAEVTIIVTGGEGCTPGYWKNNANNWEHSAWVGYLPGDSFETVFGVDVTLRGQGKTTYPTPTLLEALDANGGGINALARHAVAALLNIANPDISYGIGSTAALITMVHDAIVSGDEAQIDALHVLLADYNEAGCPLNQRGEPLMDGIV